MVEHSEWTKMAFTSIIFKNPDKEEIMDMARMVVDGLIKNFPVCFWIRYLFKVALGC